MCCQGNCKEKHLAIKKQVLNDIAIKIQNDLAKAKDGMAVNRVAKAYYLEGLRNSLKIIQTELENI